MFCPNCGKNNPDGASFCASCGAPFTQANAKPQANTAPYIPTVPIVTTVPTAIPTMAVVRPIIPGKGLGIASMVLGIVSLALFCTGWVAVICALVGCSLGGVSVKKAADAGIKNGMAVAGLVCSIIALGIDVAILIAAYSAAASVTSFIFGML